MEGNDSLEAGRHEVPREVHWILEHSFYGAVPIIMIKKKTIDGQVGRVPVGGTRVRALPYVEELSALFPLDH